MYMSSSKHFHDTAKLEVLKLKGELDTHKHEINAVAFSPDNQLLASADNDGLLLIHATENNICIRRYKALVPILKLAWNPADPSLLNVGCANGEVVKLKVSKKGVTFDDATVEQVEGWIHAMAISKTGSQMVIASGTHVEVVSNQPNATWSPSRFLAVPKIEDGVHPLVREVHIVDDLILVAFLFVEIGIIAYSATPPHSEQWRLIVRGAVLTAGTAISPSGSRLAVANMTDGVTIYDLKTRIVEETITYDIGGYRYVDLIFIDEGTIVLGHPLGAVVVATLNRDSSQRIFTIPVMRKVDPVQTLTGTLIDGKLKIVAGSTGGPQAGTIFLIEEDMDLFTRRKIRNITRKAGNCLMRTIAGLTIIAVLFVWIVPLERSASTVNLRSLPSTTLSSARKEQALESKPSTVSHTKSPQMIKDQIARTTTKFDHKPATRVKTTITTVVPISFVNPASVIPTRSRVPKTHTRAESMVVTLTETHTAPAACPEVITVIKAEKTLTVTHTEVTHPLNPTTLVDTKPIIITLTETQTTSVVDLEVITLTETRVEKAPTVTHTEIQSATRTLFLAGTATVVTPGAMESPWGLRDSMIEDLFHLGVFALCLFFLYLERDGDDPSRGLYDDVHECPATRELERIARFTTEAGARTGQHGLQGTTGSQQGPDAGTPDHDVTDGADGIRSTTHERAAPNTPIREDEAGEEREDIETTSQPDPSGEPPTNEDMETPEAAPRPKTDEQTPPNTRPMDDGAREGADAALGGETPNMAATEDGAQEGREDNMEGDRESVDADPRFNTNEQAGSKAPLGSDGAHEGGENKDEIPQPSEQATPNIPVNEDGGRTGTIPQPEIDEAEIPNIPPREDLGEGVKTSPSLSGQTGVDDEPDSEGKPHGTGNSGDKVEEDLPKDPETDEETTFTGEGTAPENKTRKGRPVRKKVTTTGVKAKVIPPVVPPKRSTTNSKRASTSTSAHIEGRPLFK